MLNKNECDLEQGPQFLKRGTFAIPCYNVLHYKNTVTHNVTHYFKIGGLHLLTIEFYFL